MSVGQETAEAQLPVRGRRGPRISGDDRERAILLTAERLLGERPLHEVSVDDLARGAGISRPAFYFYFACKESVLLALLDRLVQEQLEVEREAPDNLADDGDWDVRYAGRRSRCRTSPANARRPPTRPW